ncbi:MAG TPA: alpha/beta hydrolase [Polyangiales bacterium]|nr:alpha/beta hydrolase [Polyangiales bacterium]
MVLDPQASKFLEALAQLNIPDLSELPVEVSRKLTSQARLNGPPGPDVQVSDHQVPVAGATILVRLYRPNVSPHAGPLGVLVWMHGGGFVLGSVAESDADCRHVCEASGCAVASVEYRCAPEHRFPTALDDSFAALCWIHTHAHALGLDASRLAVGGDSAGGNLAAVCALSARERGGPALRFQALVYPITDLVVLDTASYVEFAERHYLTRSGMAWFRAQYLPRAEDLADWRASPLRAATLEGLPPALVITAEYDPLRDEGEAYAQRLAAAGVRVELQRYPGVIHGFFSMHAYMDAGKRALGGLAATLAREIAP